MTAGSFHVVSSSILHGAHQVVKKSMKTGRPAFVAMSCASAKLIGSKTGASSTASMRPAIRAKSSANCRSRQHGHTDRGLVENTGRRFIKKVVSEASEENLRITHRFGVVVLIFQPASMSSGV